MARPGSNKGRYGAWTGLASAVLLACCIGNPAAAADEPAPLPAPAEHDVNFEQHIEPIFAASCYQCHGEDRQESHFRLDYADALLRGGISGEPAIQRGDSAASHLIRLVAGQEPDLFMPPDGHDPLTDEQIGLLRAWIDQGADNTLPDGGQELATDLWSFQPLEPVDAPAAGADWAANPIDHFIYEKLAEAGLSPSEPADRVALIRRLYMVMHGLPPTPEQVRAFVEDDRPDAYERLVEDVLASPRYGERWAQHWLDVVRYGETHGFEMNQERPNAWPYRDWVIEAFNDDKPYDRFVIEQLAGDAVDVDEATGFLVAGPHDMVLSPDEGLTLMQRHEELADLVDVTGTAFLGLTMNCARCHNHMFDPVSQADFYAMQAVFAGVRHGERDVPPDEQMRRRAEDLAEQLERTEQELAALKEAADAPQLLGRRDPVRATGNEEQFEAVLAKFVRFTIETTNTDTEPCIDELEIWTAVTDGGQPQNVALASAGGVPTASGTFPGAEIHRLEHINNGEYGNSHSWISNTPGGGWVQIELAEPFTIDRITWARDRNGDFGDRLATEYRIEVASQEEGPWREVASSETRLPPDADPERMLLDALPADKADRYTALLEQRDALQSQLDEASGRAMYVGRFEQPEPTRRTYRGDPGQPREVVPPRSLAMLDGFELPPDAPEQDRRLALGEWIASEDNPLTARVMVNRIWHYHFGTGLVSTPSDFGGAGAEPSHPELLDWLAAEFIDSGWSVKHMHRLIITSQAFRQASAPDSAAAAVDVDARLLWRFPPRRGEAEVVRDSILQVSGQLDLAMGGPSFNPFVPNDNYVRVYEPLEEFGPDQFRRMIYMKRVRMEPEGVFGAFDMPDMAQACAVRGESTTALQALNLFNSPFMLDQADHFAGRLRQEAGDDAAAQIERAFELTIARQPDDYERDASRELIEGYGLTAFARAMLNLSEFIYIP